MLRACVFINLFTSNAGLPGKYGLSCSNKLNAAVLSHISHDIFQLFSIDELSNCSTCTDPSVIAHYFLI